MQLNLSNYIYSLDEKLTPENIDKINQILQNYHTGILFGMDCSLSKDDVVDTVTIKNGLQVFKYLTNPESDHDFDKYTYILTELTRDILVNINDIKIMKYNEGTNDIVQESFLKPNTMYYLVIHYNILSLKEKNDIFLSGNLYDINKMANDEFSYDLFFMDMDSFNSINSDVFVPIQQVETENITNFNSHQIKDIRTDIDFLKQYKFKSNDDVIELINIFQDENIFESTDDYLVNLKSLLTKYTNDNVVIRNTLYDGEDLNIFYNDEFIQTEINNRITNFDIQEDINKISDNPKIVSKNNILKMKEQLGQIPNTPTEIEKVDLSIKSSLNFKNKYTILNIEDISNKYPMVMNLDDIKFKCLLKAVPDLKVINNLSYNINLEKHIGGKLKGELNICTGVEKPAVLKYNLMNLSTTIENKDLSNFIHHSKLDVLEDPNPDMEIKLSIDLSMDSHIFTYSTSSPSFSHKKSHAGTGSLYQQFGENLNLTKFDDFTNSYTVSHVMPEMRKYANMVTLHNEDIFIFNGTDENTTNNSYIYDDFYDVFTVSNVHFPVNIQKQQQSSYTDSSTDDNVIVVGGENGDTKLLDTYIVSSSYDGIINPVVITSSPFVYGDELIHHGSVYNNYNNVFYVANYSSRRQQLEFYTFTNKDNMFIWKKLSNNSYQVNNLASYTYLSSYLNYDRDNYNSFDCNTVKIHDNVINNYFYVNTVYKTLKFNTITNDIITMYKQSGLLETEYEYFVTGDNNEDQYYLQGLGDYVKKYSIAPSYDKNKIIPDINLKFMVKK